MAAQPNDDFSRRVFGNELKYVREVLETEFRSSSGSTMMRRLEDAFAKRFGTKYAISFINGTATLHAALEAWGIGPGDEVIVPPLTMSAPAFSVLQANATPVFADVDPRTFQISVSSIAERITPNTRAIMPVSLYGLSPDMDPLMELARARGLKVIEDNAECFLATYKGRMVGTFGDCASFSFQSSKHMTSGEGGMIVTDDLPLAEGIRKVQSLGYAGVSATKGKITKRDIQDPNYSRHVTVGWNYRMPELCCAVALAQLENLDGLVARRVAAAQAFEAAAAGYDWLKPQYVPTGYTNSYWTWVAFLDRDDISWHEFRDRFAKLGGHGVYAAWQLSYLEPMFQKMNLLGRERFVSEANRRAYVRGLCPVAERLQPRLLQFKTNYWDRAEGIRQAEILRETLASFDRG
jgi:perosamine synthetase